MGFLIVGIAAAAIIGMAVLDWWQERQESGADEHSEAIRRFRRHYPHRAGQ